jgi:hypothetical protein
VDLNLEWFQHLLKVKGGKQSLQMAYLKHRAIVDLKEEVSNKRNTGGWQGIGPLPGGTEIVKLFMGHSSYSENGRKLFPMVELQPNASELLGWLKGGEGAPSQLEAWGNLEPTYENLRKLLGNPSAGTSSNVNSSIDCGKLPPSDLITEQKKEKEKEKEEKGKGKGKGKDKKKEREKEKEKSKSIASKRPEKRKVASGIE